MKSTFDGFLNGMNFDDGDDGRDKKIIKLSQVGSL